MEPDLRKLIVGYLKEAKLMQLATAVDNQPWVASVWFAADENLNIYWISSTTRRHSDEVSKNQKVAAGIVLPHTPQDTARGIQLQGIAEPLTNKEEIEKAISLFENRIFTREKIQQFMGSSDFPHRFYKITPTKFVLFDAVNFPDKSRQEYEVN